MTLAFLIALVVVNVGWLWLVDRKDKRHDTQLSRLIVHVQAPEQAVAHAMAIPIDGPLYIPPEDDEAWNERHKAAS